MNGYINGNTQFKTAIQDLLVLLKYEFDERINIYFINSTIHPTNISSDLAHFASELNTKSFKVGDTGSSNLNSVFKQVLQKTSKDTMSILVSDCIYSIQGSKTEELLSTQKGLTKDAFLTKSRSEKLATTIVKLTSSFNGYYWDMNNKKTMLANELRPYYITIIGSDSSMATFNSKIEINENKVKGYNNKYALSSSVNENIFYSIVETEFDNGRYRTSRDNVNSNGIHSIENIASNGRNNEHFRFSVAVDLSSVSVTSPEIQNIKNYDADGFKVVSVFAISEIRDKFPQPTLTKISKMTTIPTHLLVLEAKSKKIRDTEIKFEKHIPNWVTETSIDNDTNILNIKGKTFGLSYLIEGISEAYEITSYSKYHFVLKLNLKN